MYRLLFFIVLPFAAFAYFMALVSEDVERFYDWLEAKIENV